VSKIVNTYTESDTGQRVAQCGSWRIRARVGGVTFDVMSQECRGWEEARPEHLGLSLDDAARLLEIARGDLYTWGIRSR
jgi:hypothetical protein